MATLNESTSRLRTCGDCTLCCKIFQFKDEVLFKDLPDQTKPILTWCKYCEPGRGCHIYPVRPQTCVEYQCLWLSDTSIPEELRPDRVRAVMDVSKDGTVCVYHDQYRGESTTKGPLATYLNQLREKKTQILITNGTEVWAHSSDRKLIQINPSK